MTDYHYNGLCPKCNNNTLFTSIDTTFFIECTVEYIRESCDCGFKNYDVKQY